MKAMQYFPGEKKTLSASSYQDLGNTASPDTNAECDKDTQCLAPYFQVCCSSHI